MNDENNIQTNTVQKNRNPKNKYHASIGKIARLPADIREKINLHLHNGKSGREILAWLNDLPAVKEILAARFAGVPISVRNLCNWRSIGYQRWLAEEEKIGSLENLGKYAAGLAQAAGGNLSRGVAAVASGKLLEFLEKKPEAKPTTEDVTKCADAAAKLLKGEQNSVRLEIARERLRQREIALRLKRDKQQRDAIAIALRILEDARAQEIAAAPLNRAEKIKALGLFIFGKFWEPRPIPTQPPTQ